MSTRIKIALLAMAQSNTIFMLTTLTEVYGT